MGVGSHDYGGQEVISQFVVYRLETQDRCWYDLVSIQSPKNQATNGIILRPSLRPENRERTTGFH
jgi:hypothetical protein